MVQEIADAGAWIFDMGEHYFWAKLIEKEKKCVVIIGSFIFSS